jgi:RNase P subunit RPR2
MELPACQCYNMGMNTPHPIICDHCHRPFQIENKAEHSLDGELQYFTCPHCQHRYEYAFVTRKGLALRDKLHNIDRLRKVRDSERLRQKRSEVLAAYQVEVQSRLPSP